ncbi:MAG TPA: TonB-dependent receptor, partial [Oceanipulchritudo sp.]|nr:TonB-dependent receptor [Oceanipulchritudo sp.]
EERNGLTGESFEAWRWNSGMVLSTGPRLLLFLSAIGSQIERQHYPDDSGGWLYAVSDELDTNRSQDTGAQVTGRFQLAEATELIARGSWYRLEEADTSPGVPPGERDPFGIPANIFDNVLERKRAQGYIRHLFAPGFAVVAGAEFTDEIGTSVSLVSYPFGQIPGTYELQTKTNSLFTETAFTPLPGHQADLAVRWDDIDRIGTVRTSRASYQVDLPSLQASIRLAYGEGFKKPSLFALGNPLVGNPGLRPEESDLLELNINWQSAEGRVGSRLTVFTQDFTDLIDLSESAPPKLVNLQSVQSDGISAAVYYRHERVEELSLHVTWLDVEVKDSEELLRNRPKWKAGLSATIRIADEVFVDFHTLYIGERQDSSIPTGTLTLDDYFQTDLGLRWQLRQGLWASVIIENLWDTKYEATVGMPDPGRRVRAGIRWIY